MEATQILSEQILSETVLLAARQDDTQYLERKIASQTSGRIRDLRVDRIDDFVIISGRTSTYYVKQLATQIALDEFAEYEFQNSIEVM